MVALVQDGCGMPGGEEAVPEVAEDVEGEQVPQAAVGVEGVLDAEDRNAVCENLQRGRRARRRYQRRDLLAQ